MNETNPNISLNDVSRILNQDCPTIFRGWDGKRYITDSSNSQQYRLDTLLDVPLFFCEISKIIT